MKEVQKRTKVAKLVDVAIVYASIVSRELKNKDDSWSFICVLKLGCGLFWVSHPVYLCMGGWRNNAMQCNCWDFCVFQMRWKPPAMLFRCFLSYLEDLTNKSCKLVSLYFVVTLPESTLSTLFSKSNFSPKIWQNLPHLVVNFEYWRKNPWIWVEIDFLDKNSPFVTVCVRYKAIKFGSETATHFRALHKC